MNETPVMMEGRAHRRSGRFGLVVLVAGLLIGILLFAVQENWHSLHAQALPELRYSTTGATGRAITVGRPYHPGIAAEAPYLLDPSHPNAPKLSITLPQILAWVQSKNYTPTLDDLGNGRWQLEVTLVIEDNAEVVISRADGVEELRLISRPEASYNLISRGGTLRIDGVRVYAWDNSPGVNTYDTTYLTVNGVQQTRSYLAALYGGRMDIINAEMMYLGFEELNNRVGYGKGEPSGLAWRLRPLGATGPASGPKGSIISSKVHHLYFGMYSYQAVGMVISDTEFYENYFYGLDPHDDSYGFVVANNYIHDNGYTGLIFSRRCVNNVIYGNRIHNNGSHGFMLDRGSNHNLIYDNEIIGNKYDGIAIYQSSNNTFYDNLVKDNGRYGVRISGEFDPEDLFDDVASDNLIYNNTVLNSADHGFVLSDRADRNRILENEIHGSGGAGILLNAGLTTVLGNRISTSARDGIQIEDKPYTTGTNLGGPARPPLGAPGEDNQIVGNQVTANGQAGIEVVGGRFNQIGSLGAGNIISGNLSNGILLKRTGVITVEHNEILYNRANNGAGISASCLITNPTSPQIYHNVIIWNTTIFTKGRGAGIYIGEGCFPHIDANWIYGNRNGSVEMNLQNANLAGSATINAQNNNWAHADPVAIENTIWHVADDGELGQVDYLPARVDSLTPPPTPSPTPTFTPTPTPLISPTPTGISVVLTPTPTATRVTGNENPTVTPMPPSQQSLHLPVIIR
jgi:parallel beta-helix repeat protein